MTQLGEAVTRYNRILESDPFKDLAWAELLQEQMKRENLLLGTKPACPVLRPHFITPRQYQNLVKASESLFSTMTKVQKMVLSSPALLNRIQLLPAEKMLAAIEPGHSLLSVTGLLDTTISNGSLRFADFTGDTPSGVALAEGLSNLFYDAPPVKEFRKKNKLAKLGGETKPFANAIFKAYKEFKGAGKNGRRPSVAILEFRQPFQKEPNAEEHLLAEMLRREGFSAEVASADQLEYRNGVLRKGDFGIDVVFRRMKVNEFLVRFDLTHPLVRAYKDRAVCVVDSFRAELSHKRAILELMTDETIMAKFPAQERRAIAEVVPWTRMVRPSKTLYRGQTVDLMDYVLRNRERFVLRPNTDGGEVSTFFGPSLTNDAWDRALRQTQRTPYVVQEVVAPSSEEFPVFQYGSMQRKQLEIDVHPHSFLGRVSGCSSWLTTRASSGFVSVVGVAPVFLLGAR